MRRQMYGHLPSLRMSLPFYQVVLLGDKGTQVVCPKALHNVQAQAGVEPTTYKSQVRCPTDSVTYFDT